MKRIRLAYVLAGAGVILASHAEAAEIRLLTMAPFQRVLDEVLPAWEKSSGNHVSVVIDTPSKEERRIAAGETYDVLLSNEDSAGRLEKSGAFVGFKPVATAGMSIAVRTGAPTPDISTTASFKAAMLAARSVATTEPGPFGSSGYVLMDILDRLGITAQLKPKLVIVTPPVTAAEPVVAGQAELAFQQTSELVGTAGVTVVGPVPSDLQHSTVYVAGVAPKASEGAKALQALMAGPQARALLEQKGLGAP